MICTEKPFTQTKSLSQNQSNVNQKTTVNCSLENSKWQIGLSMDYCLNFPYITTKYSPLNSFQEIITNA